MTLVALIIVFLTMLSIKGTMFSPFSNPGQGASLAFGFILLFAFLAGKQGKRFRIPQITGYILAGILCGPFLLRFLSQADVVNLQLLDGLALSLIALTAGGEMRLEKLKRSIRTISFVVISQTFFIITGFIVSGFVLRRLFPVLSGMSDMQTFMFFLLMGTMATATSPSTTIAVINETRAAGKHSDLVLSTAVVKDFFVIILFTFVVSFSKSTLSPDHIFDLGFFLTLLKEIGGSLGIGLILGGGIILYLRYVNKEIAVFILAVAFISYQVSHQYGFHPLMVCLIAGFIVENFSSQGERFILALERSSLPVYVVFFAISGASLNLEALRQHWVLALIFVVWRAALKFTGTYTGARLAKEDSDIQKRSWAGFISQAGVTLGMVIVVERAFPHWGLLFKTLILAIIAINQIIGPVMLQKLLLRSDEAGKKLMEG